MKNEELELRVAKLESQLESNKAFTYMIIHDLKHPTESIKVTIDHQLVTFTDTIKELENVHRTQELLCQNIDDNTIVNGLEKIKVRVETI